MTDAPLALSLLSVRRPTAQAGSERAHGRGGRAPMLASSYAARPSLGAGRHEIPTPVGAWTIKPPRLQRFSIRVPPVTQPEITPSRADIIPRLVPVGVLT